MSGAQPLPGEFLLKFSFQVDPGSWYQDPQGNLMTGIPSIDTLNVQYQVTDMVPVFYPLSTDPDVREDEEEVGLDRIFNAFMDPVFDPETVADDYDADPNTDYAESNQPGDQDAEPRYIPNDIYFYRQWSLHNTGQTGGTPDADIDAPEAWMIQHGDSNVVIAILDGEVKLSLDDFEPHIWVNPGEDMDGDGVVYDTDDLNGVNDDANGYTDDLVGWNYRYKNGDVREIGAGRHGTLVGGMLTAVTDNDSVIASTSMHCKLMVLVTNDNGPISTSVAAKGIKYAATMGADVINMSWSYSSEQQTIRDACVFAYDRDCILVASAGNSNNQSLRYPAAWESSDLDIISVAGTDDEDHRYSSSTYGTWVDVCAPSAYVMTLKADTDTTRVYGTSFGAAIVSGIAALIRSAEPGMSNQDVITQIQSTTDNIDALNPGFAGKLGSGRVNAHRALQLNLRYWNPDEQPSTHGAFVSAGVPDVAAVGDTVYAVWAETPLISAAGGAGSPTINADEIYYSRSTDNGETWSAPVLLSADDWNNSNWPTVAAEGGEVYVAWTDSKWGAKGDISFRYSGDYGGTFGTEANVSNTSATGWSERPDIAMADSVAHLVWVERPAGNDDCYYRALKGGSVSGASYNVSSHSGDNEADVARVDVYRDTVQVVWEQDGGGQTRIKHKRNTDKGNSSSWSASSTVRSGTFGTIENPDVAATGRYVYVVWSEDTDGNPELWLKRNISRGGSGSWKNALQITPSDDGMDAEKPRVTAEGTLADIVWSSYSGLNHEVYHSWSRNNGQSFTSPGRVTFTGGDSFDPSIACLPGGGNETNSLFLVWSDNSDPNMVYQIRFKRRTPYLIGNLPLSDSYNFDDHDLSGWGLGMSGGDSISISPGPNVSSPNSLRMNSQLPGYAWARTPESSLDLAEAHWLSTWLYLEGVVNDGIIVMDNGEVRLEILAGTDLVSGTGVPIEALIPYTWYLIECYADPSLGTYDVYVNEGYRATVSFESGPPEQTILVGDVIDGPAGFGTVRWDNLGFEGLRMVGVDPLPPPDLPYRRLRIETFPNPFARGTNILFTLLGAGSSPLVEAGTPGLSGEGSRGGQKVILRIFDARGRLVRTMRDTAQRGVPKLILWDGRDRLGRESASGIYFIQVGAYRESGCGKVILVR
jgi:hypothetical protein